jgi:competence protein ComEC
VAILRGRAGDYVRDMLAESSGIETELSEIDALPGARCNDHVCVATIGKDKRQWRILATRTRWPLLIEPLVAACKSADIVISDRRLPRTCTPRWLKADAPFLARTGGLAIRLGDPPHLAKVVDGVGKHPWSFFGQPRAGWGPGGSARDRTAFPSRSGQRRD